MKKKKLIRIFGYCKYDLLLLYYYLMQCFWIKVLKIIEKITNCDFEERYEHEERKKKNKIKYGEKK